MKTRQYFRGQESGNIPIYAGFMGEFRVHTER